MKKLRILKIYQEEERFEQKLELKGHNVMFSGSLYYLSNELSLFYWHGCPFKYLPSNFYPESIVSIDLSYSNIKQLWTTPKSFRRLKVMKLRYCCNLTTTPDFSEITNLEELDLEGCVNLVTVHPSIGMLKRLVVLNMRDCRRATSFPSKVEMDSLQVLNLPGCLNVNQLPEEAFWSRWWTFGLLSKQQHPQRSVSLAGLHMLNDLNLSYCNLVQVPESIGGLSCLKVLKLEGNNFTSLPGSLSQLSHLGYLDVYGCKNLEVLPLPELPPSLYALSAHHCTSLRSITGSSEYPFMKNMSVHLSNCPKLFTSLAIDSHASISKTQCLDSSITSQGSTNRFSAFLQYVGIQNNRCEFFRFPGSFKKDLDIIYDGNSIPEWFTNKSMGNHVKVELPSDWCFNKFRGYGTCVVLKIKKPCKHIGYFVYFDGPSPPCGYGFLYLDKTMGIQDSYMIWLEYVKNTGSWKEAKNFVTFRFLENEDYEVKECGARRVCDGDLEQDTNMSML